MKDRSVDRRTFMGMLGAGSATLLSAPRLIATTERGVLVESDSEYGGFVVEKLSGGSFPYECDESVLQRMSQKFNVFSRNRWDPERTEILDAAEDVSERNLVELEGIEPNQTRLDYALMAAAWRHATMGGGQDYSWDIRNGMLMGAGLHEMEQWDPTELDMTWEEASLAVRHAALFFGASLVGIAELNPLPRVTELA